MGQNDKHEDFQAKEPAAIYNQAGPRRGAGLRPDQTVERVRAGLPMVEFEGLREWLGLTAEALARHLAIPRSTLARRKKAGHLDMQESDRLLRYARLFRRCIEVLGSEKAAREWLATPARGLGFAAPLEFAETEVGVREVENLLGRIEHGVFS